MIYNYFFSISLKSLTDKNPELKAKLEEISSKNSSFEQEYTEKHKLISSAVTDLFKDVPLRDYFDPKTGLVTSNQLITYLMCDRQTWKNSEGKNLARYSLFDTCQNIYKIRAIDQANGLCFTLFHEAALIALQKTGLDSKRGRDEIITPDPESLGN